MAPVSFRLVLAASLVTACTPVPPEGEANNGVDDDDETSGSTSDEADEESSSGSTSTLPHETGEPTAPTEVSSTSVGTSTTTGVGSDDMASESSGTEPEEPRGPTPPRDGANFPFPQNRETPHCFNPAHYKNSDVVAAYEKWRTDTVTSEGAGGYLRVKRTPSDGNLALGSTVSEGIAYGMLIAVY